MNVVFLDRDGVVNQFPGHGSYVTKVRDFKFLPGSKKAIAQLTRLGYKIFIISNQAGVGRGLFSKEKLDQIDAFMHRKIREAGGKITQSLYCPHHPDQGCDCRKPNLGNVKQALKSIGCTLAQAKGCFFVGDAWVDMELGRQAGLKTIFVKSGKSTEAQIRREGAKPDYVVANLAGAVRIILHEDPRHPRHRRSGA